MSKSFWPQNFGPYALIWLARCLLAGLVVMWATAALADKRVALVVGNSNYKHIPALPNPVNDAQDVADKLTRLGFDVVTGIDVDLQGWRAALQQFERKAANADAAVFYFAGHGMQHQGQNYLMPVNAVLKDETSLVYDMIAVNDIKNAFDRARIGVRIMILDACRNNPLAESFNRAIDGPTRSVTAATRGLARIGKAEGMVVVYATMADQVAEDGKSTRNSPFTSALLARLDEPGVEIATLFRRVQGDVISKTAQKQQPELTIALAQEFYLNTNETDAMVWARISEAGDPLLLRDFIEKYPGSAHLRDARFRLDVLNQVKSSGAAAEEANARAAAKEAALKAELEAKTEEAAKALADRQRAEATARRENADRIAALEKELKQLRSSPPKDAGATTSAGPEREALAIALAEKEKALAELRDKEEALRRAAADRRLKDDAENRELAEREKKQALEQKRRLAESMAQIEQMKIEAEEAQRRNADGVRPKPKAADSGPRKAQR